MDIFSLALATTLAVVGVFSLRDFCGALRGQRITLGRVKSITHLSGSFRNASESPTSVNEGFYPVIEYLAEGAAVQFTAVCQSVSGKFQVGDRVRIRLIKTRRQNNRWGRGMVALIAASVLLAGILLYAAASPSYRLSISQIVLGSSVLALALFTMVLYLRGLDEACMSGKLKQSVSGLSEMCLAEPTAFSKWKRAARESEQWRWIWGTQAFGLTCVIWSAFVVLFALKPLGSAL